MASIVRSKARGSSRSRRGADGARAPDQGMSFCVDLASKGGTLDALARSLLEHARGVERVVEEHDALDGAERAPRLEERGRAAPACRRRAPSRRCATRRSRPARGSMPGRRAPSRRPPPGSPAPRSPTRRGSARRSRRGRRCSRTVPRKSASSRISVGERAPGHGPPVTGLRGVGHHEADARPRSASASKTARGAMRRSRKGVMSMSVVPW